MIAPVHRSTDSRTVESQQQAHELLCTIMTERVRRWMMKKALRWFDGDWNRAADLVQDTFLALLKTKSYDPSKCSPITYAHARLRGIRSHYNRESVTRQSRFSRLSFDPVSPSVGITLERKETVAQVAKAIESLPPRDATILLDFFSGVSTAETGRKLGVTRQCIYQRQSKALGALQHVKLPVSA